MCLSLPLLVSRVLPADDPDHAGAPDDLAVLTNGFDAAADLHDGLPVYGTAVEYIVGLRFDQANTLTKAEAQAKAKAKAKVCSPTIP
jgi:hypothetical protein